MDAKKPKPADTLVSLSAVDAILDNRAALASDSDANIDAAKLRLDRFSDDQLIEASKFLRRIGMGAKD